ncbi:Uncharacterized SAM-binding protein YcdF, DUF218 family [Rhizobiales bacterium GAS113]|nr:Uncharacterized SAM-binding protein YcdF, DUF218 family [Rhizobiales bacterium GAS113]
MFYFFSKLPWLLFGAPIDALFSFTVITTLYAVLGASRRAGLLAAIGILGFFVASFTPAGYWLMLPLENRFPRWQIGPEIPDGIIALGGDALGEESARVTALVELGRRFPKSRLFLIAGGQADELRAEIISLGGDPGRLVTEGKSRNTSENAINAARIIKPRPDQHWILITTSWHMPRAVGCFRASGFDVNAYPVDFRANHNARDDALKVFPGSDSSTYFNLAVKEWIGLVAYRLAGKTHEFFPAP